jgi:hypothetical protein
MKHFIVLLSVIILLQISISFTQNALIDDYFFLQKFYPGINVIGNIEYVLYRPRLKYFILNTKLFYYSNSIEESRQIQGLIKLKDIIDRKRDYIKEGKCCVNVKYLDYSKRNNLNIKRKKQRLIKKPKRKSKLNLEKKDLSQENKLLEMLLPNFNNKKRKNPKTSIDKTISKRYNSKSSKTNNISKNKRKNHSKLLSEQQQLNLLFFNKNEKIPGKKSKSTSDFKSKYISKRHITGNNKLNFCVEIFILNKTKWRICSTTRTNIYRLYIQLKFNIIRTGNKIKGPAALKKMFYKFLSWSHFPAKKMTSWNWDFNNQDKWEDNCKSKLMQSPRRIEEYNTSLHQKRKFQVNYKFESVKVEIVKHGPELIVLFKENPGLLMISFRKGFSFYYPKYISFRFPAQHIVLGKRFPGEILITFEDKVKEEVSS